MSVAPKTAAAMTVHWDGRAHRFEGAASHNRDRDAWRDVLAAAVGQGAQRVVDLGCGTGACAVLLAGMGHHVTGVDGSSAMLAEARRAAARDGVHVDFIHADMDQCGLANGAADVVTLRNVLWTLEDPAEALHLAARLLRPGGKVLVSDGVWRRNPDPTMADLAAHLPNACGVSEVEARDWLCGAGFGGITVWHDRFVHHPYGGLYDEPETPIPFFVLTAIRAEATRS
ncbi:class I SAM-dependent methyltransferase [Paracoccus denitrificans]|jgi:SAM-dependent methyltransferase|uniref:Methyltransferase type 11 n=1 Tax=Paracoccus denitrificans (strain Pd 1222) TaxID=318586 RepID=A1B6C3_PARDP|nr:class I SAM-dependent methyltransferase [Paracoccus pantotrophus]ABL71067.1 Methyltransferase type 11 [Paracoccus denitrificans PD1222]QAR27735.1 class I SAM-dependent methyltransferase [Paracoccus denitrificans]RDD93812.1 class I SAM-dependent methyltransferase [Paracoccus pantotrophus]WGR65057.1 class I SAM-dependent methyltransferase [Paracoccus pantotrophus]SDJ91362.1 Methyltransferase domain-containing protein [Paracoccus denitrificans]